MDEIRMKMTKVMLQWITQKQSPEIITNSYTPINQVFWTKDRISGQTHFSTIES